MALIFRCGVSPGLKERHDQLFCELVDSSSCYGCYKELCGFFQKYCKTSDRILTAVCALSDCNRESLIEDLYDAGYHSVVGVDSSGSYIKSSRERNKEKRPEMHFLEGHVLNVRTLSGISLSASTCTPHKGLLTFRNMPGITLSNFICQKIDLAGIFIIYSIFPTFFPTLILSFQDQHV